MKQNSIKRYCPHLVFSILLTVLPTLATAQNVQSCEFKYNRVDRGQLSTIFEEVKPVLFSMASISTSAADMGILQSKREFLSEYFEYLKTELDRIGNPNHQYFPFSGISRDFIESVVNQTFLGLSNSTLLGATPYEAAVNARYSLDAVNLAISKLSLCFGSSWDRLPLPGAVNDRRCAGGFHKRDRQYVEQKAFEAAAYVIELSRLANIAAQGVFGSTDRLVRQADFDYTRENLELLGAQDHPLVSNKTRYFLNTLIDPTFLDLKRLSIDGALIADSQANARIAVQSSKRAYQILADCVYE